MSTDETTNATNEFVDHVPTARASEADVAPTPQPGWNRRTFLKAAALGAAAAALMGKDGAGRLASARHQPWPTPPAPICFSRAFNAPLAM